VYICRKTIVLNHLNVQVNKPQHRYLPNVVIIEDKNRHHIRTPCRRNST